MRTRGRRPVEIVLEVDPSLARVVVAALLLAWPRALGSEDRVLITQYASPGGIYTRLVTTGAGNEMTILNRNGGNAILVPPTNTSGGVSIGTTSPPPATHKLHVERAVRSSGYARFGGVHFGNLGASLAGFHGDGLNIAARPDSGGRFEVRDVNNVLFADSGAYGSAGSFIAYGQPAPPNGGSGGMSVTGNLHFCVDRNYLPPASPQGACSSNERAVFVNGYVNSSPPVLNSTGTVRCCRLGTWGDPPP